NLKKRSTTRADVRTEPHTSCLGQMASSSGIYMSANYISGHRQEAPRTSSQSIATTAQHLTSTLESLAEAYALLDKEGRFLYVNRKAEQLIQQTAESLLGKCLWEEFNNLLGSEFHQSCQRLPHAREATECTIYYSRLRIWLEIRAIPSDEGMVVSLRDVTERQWIQQFHTRQAEILESIAANAPLPCTLEAIAHLAESASPHYRCAIFLLETSGHRLMLGAAPNLPPALIESVESMAFAWREKGDAASQEQAAFFDSLQTQPEWETVQATARQHALQSCWSAPIISNRRQVLGIFAVYCEEAREPEAGEVELLTSCSHLISVAIERQRATQALMENERRFRQQRSEERRVGKESRA